MGIFADCSNGGHFIWPVKRWINRIGPHLGRNGSGLEKRLVGTLEVAKEKGGIKQKSLLGNSASNFFSYLDLLLLVVDSLPNKF